EVYIIADSQAAPEILALANDTVSGAWNGDDALVLERDGIVIDSFGQVGFDPGTSWGGGTSVITLNNTLRRNGDVCTGDTDSSDVFDPALEWTGFGTDVFDG